MPHNVITRFESGYLLAVHPYPPVVDVLMIFQQNSFDPDTNTKPFDTEASVDEEVYNYKDFGLAPRLGPADGIPPEREGLVEEFNKVTNEKQTSLKSREVSILAPLSLLDWTHWLGVVKMQTNSIGFCQLLPVGHRAVHAF